METKKFTVLQLFSIIDGRLATKIEDVYEILNHLTGQSLYTHHLPVAMEYLKTVSPVWYLALKFEIDTIKAMYDDDFKKVTQAIESSYNMTMDIPSLTPDEMKGFNKYMLDNSLLKIA